MELAGGTWCKPLAAVLLLVLMMLLRAADAKEHVVGGEYGWTIPNSANALNYKFWAMNTKFRVGDTLVFKYNPSLHNVLEVGRLAMDVCDPSDPVRRYSGGETRVKLEKTGLMSFICGVPTHCSLGQALPLVVSAEESTLVYEAVLAPESPPDPYSAAPTHLLQASRARVIVSIVIVAVFLIL